MLATINTDASFNFKYKVGTYAIWVSSNQFRAKKFGVLKGHIDSSLIAEIKSILNGLYVLKKAEGIKRVIINTDCVPAIKILKKSNKQIRLWCEKRPHFTFLPEAWFLARAGFEIEFRHVKAHNGTPDARSYVNDWCDTHAKKAIQTILISKANENKISIAK